jgi:hypothetical protein
MLQHPLHIPHYVLLGCAQPMNVSNGLVKILQVVRVDAHLPFPELCANIIDFGGIERKGRCNNQRSIRYVHQVIDVLGSRIGK